MSDPAPPSVLALDTVDSTNAEALRRAHERPLWIVARRQTAPRGSRGRPWAMPAGNLAATLALRQRGTPPGLSRLGFVAGLALHDALGALTGEPARLALKWPNDVLLDGGKLAGILLERERSAGDAYTLAIGFGVNLAAAPEPDPSRPEAPRPVALAPRWSVSPEALLDALRAAFAAREAEMAESGFEPIRAAWLARAARLGEPVTARTLRETRTGVFETIDAWGHLILRTPAGCHRIASADVFFEGA